MKTSRFSTAIAVYIAAPAAFALPACSCDEQLGTLSAQIDVEPKMIDFGRVALNHTAEEPLTIRNIGSFRLELTSFTTEAPFIAPAGTATVVTGSSIQKAIGFRPTALGPASGVLTIATSIANAGTLDIPMTGEGIQAAVSIDPPEVDFGEVLWNASTPPQKRTVTVSNPGSDSFELTALDVANDGAGSIMVDRMNAVKTYAPGDSATFEVTYVPNARGPITGELRIRTTAPADPELVVPVRASAVGPVIQLCSNLDGQPRTCTMGTMRPNIRFLVERTAMGHGQVAVLNVGDRDLTINAMLVNGPAMEFAFVPAPSMMPIVVPPGGEVTWEATYTPQDYAFDSVIVSYASDAPGGIESLRVEGDVLRGDLEVVPRGLTFRHTGNVPRGQTHVRLYNCGTAPLTVGAITVRQITGPAAAFSLENLPMDGTVIQPQPQCSAGAEGAGFDVVFATTTDGNYMGEVSIPSNDPVEPVVPVSVAGTKD